MNPPQATHQLNSSYKNPINKYIKTQQIFMFLKFPIKQLTISIHKLFYYNYRKINIKKYKYIENMSSKQSIEETLRKSREVQERYQKYLQEKAESDKHWEETEAKINRTLERLSQTKDTIKQIDQLYQNYQKTFENAINAALEKIQKSRPLEVADPDFVPHHGTAKQVADLLKKKKKVVFMTGAGVSAASGIPTFRDKDGYWMKKKFENLTPQQFLSFSNFEQNPMQIWEWLQDFYCTKEKCKPNIGHTCIDSICNKLLSSKAEVCLITQNIDSFHRQSQSNSASNKKDSKKYPIYQVHGNILKVRCDNCAKDQPQMICYPYKQYRKFIMDKKNLVCDKCSSTLRPHIMFFDEFYTQKFHHSDSVKEFVDKADMLIVIGTALQTGLARNVVQNCLERKIPIIELNIQCIIRQKGVIWMQGKSDEALVGINKLM